MNSRSALSRSGEIRIERRHYCVLHAPRYIQCAGLVARQGLREIGGVTISTPNGLSQFASSKSIGGVPVPQAAAEAEGAE